LLESKDTFKEERPVAGMSVKNMADLTVDYKCANCGAIQSFTRDREGKWQPAMTCKACGSRIFIKLRRTGHKILDAE
jgi:DNA-directed RNA polymerase subunit RPC12/RpoP|tara:strand:+ start:66 stop:296 length:231 start_codon:yes stop_codon:yes gene_type:complete